MIQLIIIGILWIGGIVFTIWTMKRRDEDGADIAMTASLVGAGGGLVGLIMFFITTGFVGLNPDYGTGTSSGYITLVKEEGIFWKTVEVEFQRSQGGDSSIRGECSTVNRELLPALRKAQEGGYRIRLIWDKWLFQPWPEGKTNCQLTKIEAESG